MSSKTTLFSLAALTALVSLGGCGGGGGGDSTASVTASNAQGVYEGTISNGRSHQTIVLENDQFYTIYGSVINGGLSVTGFLQGNGKSNNGNFNADDVKDYFGNGTAVTGSLSASYTPNTSLNGSMTTGTSAVTFTGVPIANSSYNYNAAANLANIAGSWGMRSHQGDLVFINISSNGALAGSSPGGCTFKGAVSPRASGKNVFNVTITFGAAPCRLPGQTANGIGVEYLLQNGLRQLLIAGTDLSRNNGTVFMGRRSATANEPTSSNTNQASAAAPFVPALPVPTTGTSPGTISTPPVAIATVPPLATTKTQLVAGTIFGTVFWPEGDTAQGGQGTAPVGIVSCSNGDESYHIHSHLTIFNNGQMLAVPGQIGIPTACTYELHTHDRTGEIHMEAPVFKPFKLGDLFALWGQPLTRTNIAGITTTQPVVVYVNDGNDTAATVYEGNLADLEFKSHRSITIQIGTPITAIPTYIWDFAT